MGPAGWRPSSSAGGPRRLLPSELSSTLAAAAAAPHNGEVGQVHREATGHLLDKIGSLVDDFDAEIGDLRRRHLSHS